MRRTNLTATDREWLQRLGKNLDDLIKKKGYKSPYDFWVNKAGDHLSRSALNYVLTGKTDPKATTLRILARLLDVKPSKIVDLDD